MNGDDILWAMKSLGFEDAVVVLTTYLQKIREVRFLVPFVDYVSSVLPGSAVSMVCAGVAGRGSREKREECCC